MPELKFCPQCAVPLILQEKAGRERLVCSDAHCGFVFWDNPLPVVAGIVEYEDKIVLARNAWWPEGLFGLITGFLERGESPEEGILREMEEEIGLKGEIIEFMGNYPFFRKNELIIVFHIKAYGEITLGEEIAEIRQVPIAKVRPWDSPTGEALGQWLARRDIFNEPIIRTRR
jgi:NAD+ diphosphatase